MNLRYSRQKQRHQKFYFCDTLSGIYLCFRGPPIYSVSCQLESLNSRQQARLKPGKLKREADKFRVFSSLHFRQCRVQTIRSFSSSFRDYYPLITTFHNTSRPHQKRTRRDPMAISERVRRSKTTLGAKRKLFIVFQLLKPVKSIGFRVANNFFESFNS